MTKEQMKEQMLQMGITEENLSKLKTKEDYENTLNGLLALESVEQIDSENDIQDNIDNNDKKTPDIYSPEWTTYILSLMSEDEKRDGHPTVDGLRRVVDQLFHIQAVKSKVYESPSNLNGYHATVKVTIITEAEMMDACADAGVYNTEAKYGRHSVATAESRAEARAYRKILRLRNIISAEEVVNELEIGDPTERIQDAQLIVMDNILKKLNINAKKWFESRDIQVDKVAKMSRATASTLCAELNALQTIGVEDKFLGYEEWR